MNTAVREPTDSLTASRNRLLFFIILGTGIVLRVINLFRLEVVSGDSPAYIHDAMAIGTEGLRSLFVHGFSGNFSIYPVLLYAVNLFVGQPILSGQLVSLFFGCLLIVPVYFLTKEMMGPRAGLFAAFLTAVHPHLIRYSGEVLKDSMLFFFAISSVVLALSGHDRKKYLVIFLAGIMAWTTSFVRIYGIVVVVSISVAIIVSGLIDRRRLRTVAQELFLFAIPAPLVGYLLFILFVGINNEYIIQSLMNLFLSITERFSHVASYRDVLISNNPGVDPQYLNVITSYPWLSAITEYFNVFLTAFSVVAFPFFLIGIYLSRSVPVRRGPCAFVLSCAGVVILVDLFIVMTVYFLSKRHVMIAVILLLPWSAMALDQIIPWYKERVRRKYRMKPKVFTRIVILIFVVWVIVTLAYTSLSQERTKWYYKRTAGEYIKSLGQPDPLILVPPSDSMVPLYAGGEGIIFGDAATLERTLAERKPDFVLWDTDSGPLPESIRSLSDKGIVIPIQTIKGTRDDSIVIYRREKD